MAVVKGVATRWTGVDMSTHFYQKSFLRLMQIQCFYSGGGGWESVMVWAPKAKRFSASGSFAPWPPDQGLCCAPGPHYRLAFRALATRVRPTSFDLAMPLAVVCCKVTETHGRQADQCVDQTSVLLSVWPRYQHLRRPVCEHDHRQATRNVLPVYHEVPAVSRLVHPWHLYTTPSQRLQLLTIIIQWQIRNLRGQIT